MSETYKARIKQCENALRKNLSRHLPEAKRAADRAMKNLENAKKMESSARTAISKKNAAKRRENAVRRAMNAQTNLTLLGVTIDKRKKRLAELKAGLQKSTSK